MLTFLKRNFDKLAHLSFVQDPILVFIKDREHLVELTLIKINVKSILSLIRLLIQRFVSLNGQTHTLDK